MLNNNSIDKRIVKSKQALKSAILSLLKDNDIKEITVTEIVKQANVNRGTFYKHYQYKEDILEEIMDDVITDLIISFREPYKDSETFKVSNLTSSAIKIFEHVKKYSEFYILIVQSTSLISFQSKISHVLKGLALKDLSDGNQLNPKINKELNASFYAYAILGMIIEWINQGYQYSSSYMAEQLLEIIKNSQANDAYQLKVSIEDL